MGEDAWDLCEKYLFALAVKFGWTPDQVFDSPWRNLVQMTLMLDDLAAANAPAPVDNYEFRKMA